mmetsp:Transcript_48482/g.128031  ORF Transcript_48482/g.128031 Transcript_48482/m.128031 type:complete len:479 (+) Transcript_48482:68-1504(+)
MALETAAAGAAAAAVKACACDLEGVGDEPCSSNPSEESSSADCSWDGAPRKGPLTSSGAFRKGGTAPTALCLSKAAIGAGVLSIAAHTAEVGILMQFTGLVVGAALTLVSIHMIATASIKTGRWSYEDINDELFHPAMSLFTGCINVCNCVGSGAGYLIVCGQVFQVLTGAGEEGRRLFVVLVGVFVCGPLSLARHVGFMRYLAAVSITALFLLVGSVVWYLGEYGADETVTPETLMYGAGGATVGMYMNSINNVVFAYNNQFNVPQLTGELTPAPSTKRMMRVSACSTMLCFGVYLFVSIFGVLAFGVGENQGDSLVLDLLPARKQWNVVMSMGAVMFSVLCSFQFHVYPIRQFSLYAARKARGRGADDEETDVKYCGRSLTRWLDIASALGSVAVIILIAVVVTSLQTVLNFVGAFASAYTSYVVPPLWIIQLARRQEGFTWCNKEMVFCLLVFSIGLFFFVFGTYTAVAGAISGA